MRKRHVEQHFTASDTLRVHQIPEEERKEVRDVFREYGLTDEEITPIVTSLEKRP